MSIIHEIVNELRECMLRQIHDKGFLGGRNRRRAIIVVCFFIHFQYLKSNKIFLHHSNLRQKGLRLRSQNCSQNNESVHHLLTSECFSSLTEFDVNTRLLWASVAVLAGPAWRCWAAVKTATGFYGAAGPCMCCQQKLAIKTATERLATKRTVKMTLPTLRSLWNEAKEQMTKKFSKFYHRPYMENADSPSYWQKALEL